MLYRLIVTVGLVSSASADDSAGTTCYDLKAAYQGSACCGTDLHKHTSYFLTTDDGPRITAGSNPCEGTKPSAGFDNFDCVKDNVVQALEQAGTNVTIGYKGQLQTDAVPITTSYFEAGMCPVNVHWHLGTEHYSMHEYDEHGTGPHNHRRNLATGEVRKGYQCHKYDAESPGFSTPYAWKYCVGMEVGETYEVHWPHSAAGDCGTPNQYQTPFYDGVFCHAATKLTDTASQIGVHAQVFTIVNDDHYYYPDMIRGMIVDGEYGADIAYYTGSTTGTSRNNEICSAYTPITWQVDRKCHLISASSFDKMCMDMKAQRDDMTYDLEAHGARELVADHLAADNHQRRKLGWFDY